MSNSALLQHGTYTKAGERDADDLLLERALDDVDEDGDCVPLVERRGDGRREGQEPEAEDDLVLYLEVVVLELEHLNKADHAVGRLKVLDAEALLQQERLQRLHGSLNVGVLDGAKALADPVEVAIKLGGLHRAAVRKQAGHNLARLLRDVVVVLLEAPQEGREGERLVRAASLNKMLRLRRHPCKANKN